MMENVHFIGQFWRMRNASSWELHYDSYPVRLHCCCCSTWCSQTPSWSRGCCPGPAGRSAGWTGWRGPRCSSWSRSQGTPGPRVGDHLAETQRRECRTCSSSSVSCKYEQIRQILSRIFSRFSRIFSRFSRIFSRFSRFYRMMFRSLLIVASIMNAWD